MNKLTFETTIINRLQADDFAQPQKKPWLQRLWRKLCAMKA